ncbi:acetylxylan esterase [Stieleria sp. JC731]|uniref:alpha/beta hydrolase family protein n=1 Tax=Pirellulaceae TaxID=2691357 RepID=UPI001E3CA1AE|nr:acetylxylan esterase [Stieleria sp. JC731]MCC9601368.1 acetylxylan esterase [Stieleria sp. JC731]
MLGKLRLNWVNAIYKATITTSIGCLFGLVGGGGATNAQVVGVQVTDAKTDNESASSQTPAINGDELAAEYFRDQTSQIASGSLRKFESLEQWTQQRGEFKEQLLDMLGLNPFPAKSALNAAVTSTHEADGVVVENVQFQSLPGLYVTGNFYRPAKQQGPLPAVLYVCGHGREVKDGVSLGNKTHYQHHGGWFARNGYVCLTIDTIQLGEIEGVHHGTYRKKMWWWNNRGYTPAGVEAFNCVRALDYLQSRQEVEGDRIGVTGRSGGGAYSWWIAAIDERIKVAVPVAGITNMVNHVVDGCVEGHCDCMYMVNRFRWDFSKVAALVAPRPLLISNTDSDRIFPLDGVVDLHADVRHIYELYDSETHLGLHLTQGPHKDTQELRVGAFRWLNRFLRDDDSLIQDVATPLFKREQLKVFDQLPSDEQVTSIHETFVPKVDEGLDVESVAAVNNVIAGLRSMTFNGWPKDETPLDIQEVTSENAAADCRVLEFSSQHPYRLTAYVICRAKDRDAPTEITVLDQQSYQAYAPALAALFPGQLAGVKPDPEKVQQFVDESCSCNQAFLIPRDVGPTRASEDDRGRTHMRRRYMLLGQTLFGMQIYDVVRGIEALREFEPLRSSSIIIGGEGDAAVLAAYASLMSKGVGYFGSADLPKSNRDAPDLLNVSRVIELVDVQKIVESSHWPRTESTSD